MINRRTTPGASIHAALWVDGDDLENGRAGGEVAPSEDCEGTRTIRNEEDEGKRRHMLVWRTRIVHPSNLSHATTLWGIALSYLHGNPDLCRDLQKDWEAFAPLRRRRRPSTPWSHQEHVFLQRYYLGFHYDSVLIICLALVLGRTIRNVRHKWKKLMSKEELNPLQPSHQHLSALIQRLRSDDRARAAFRRQGVNIDDIAITQKNNDAEIVRVREQIKRVLHAYEEQMPILIGEEAWYLPDITHGKEPLPIPVINEVDTDPLPRFEYITDYRPGVQARQCHDEGFLSGCECKDGCGPQCPCVLARFEEGCHPYSEDGRLMDVGTRDQKIGECNRTCWCHQDRTRLCRNSVVQRPARIRLEVFKTTTKGWGVRTRQHLKAGTFVTSYLGELLTNDEANERNSEYLFDLPNEVPNCEYTVDASMCGNVARFINHSCNPNLVTHNVWTDNPDHRFPRLALFCRRDVAKGEELSFDYMITGQSSATVECYCGAASCRGRIASATGMLNL